MRTRTLPNRTLATSTNSLGLRRHMDAWAMTFIIRMLHDICTGCTPFLSSEGEQTRRGGAALPPSTIITLLRSSTIPADRSACPPQLLEEEQSNSGPTPRTITDKTVQTELSATFCALHQGVLYFQNFAHFYVIGLNVNFISSLNKMSFGRAV
jgi:hypothetical protein